MYHKNFLGGLMGACFSSMSMPNFAVPPTPIHCTFLAFIYKFVKGWQKLNLKDYGGQRYCAVLVSGKTGKIFIIIITLRYMMKIKGEKSAYDCFVVSNIQ